LRGSEQRRFVMKSIVAITALFLVLATTTGLPPLQAQAKKDPLTDKQIEEVREAGDQPPQRLTLYIGYIDERAKGIHSLSADPHAQYREDRLHTLYEEFTRLSDELQDNMDAFDGQHADLRKVLKVIVDKTGEWTTILNEPKPSPQYDFAQKTALDSNQTAHETASQMLPEEVKYFAEKKKAEKEAEKEEQKR
jgi:hypothetical protein